MLSYCLKCKKNAESKNLKVGRTKTEEYFYQNVQRVIVKNWYSSKSKKLVDY